MFNTNDTSAAPRQAPRPTIFGIGGPVFPAEINEPPVAVRVHAMLAFALAGTGGDRGTVH